MTSQTCSVVGKTTRKSSTKAPNCAASISATKACVSALPSINPGEVGAVDPGHDGAWELFYCVAGEAILDDGTNE
jgi:hypothetical protein